MSDRPGEAYLYRFNELVKRVTNAKGGEPMAELAAELLPCLTLENDRPEWYRLGGTTLFIGITSVAAGGVGLRSIAQLFNPLLSGVLTVLQEIYCEAIAGQKIGVAFYDTALVSITANQPSAADRIGGGATTTRFRFDNTAALPVVNQVWEVEAATPLRFTRPIILGPGRGVIVYPGADNVALPTVSMYGYERGREDSEVGGR